MAKISPKKATPLKKKSLKASKISDYFRHKSNTTANQLTTTAVAVVPPNSTSGDNRATNTFDHKCDECPKSFVSQLRLSNHLVAVHKRRAFQCPKCEWKGINNQSMIRHRFSHTRDEMVAMGFNQREKIITTSLGASVSQYVVCGFDDCPQVFKTYTGLFIHIPGAHNVDKYSDYFDKCMERSVPPPPLEVVPINRQELALRQSITGDRDLQVPSAMAIEWHNDDNSVNVKQESIDDHISGETDNQTFSFASELLKQNSSIDNTISSENTSQLISNVSYYCNDCELSFPTELCLRKHLGNIHKNPVFACDSCEWRGCDQRSRNTHILKQHKNLENNQNLGSTPTTTTTTTTSTAIVKTKQSPQKVKKCGVKGLEVHSMKKHRKKHRRLPVDNAVPKPVPKPTKCNVMAPIEQYKESPTDYRCHDCGISCSTELCLRKHLGDIHKIAAFQCEQCEWTGYSKSQRKGHTRKFHNYPIPKLPEQTTGATDPDTPFYGDNSSMGMALAEWYQNLGQTPFNANTVNIKQEPNNEEFIGFDMNFDGIDTQNSSQLENQPTFNFMTAYNELLSANTMGTGSAMPLFPTFSGQVARPTPKSYSLGFDCTLCYKSFHTKARLRLHISKDHNLPGYECEHCEWKGISIMALNKHKLIHT
ncbi:unnamed protein product, partial [Oppiella nova]